MYLCFQLLVLQVSAGVKMESVRLKQEDVTKVLADVRSLKGKQENISARMDDYKRYTSVVIFLTLDVAHNFSCISQWR